MMTDDNSTVTCLVQTFRDDALEQMKQVRASLAEVSSVEITSLEPVVGSFGLVLRLKGQLQDLVNAIERLRSLSFVQNVATYLVPSKDIVPDKIGNVKVSEDAKSAIVGYIQRMQGSLVRSIDDLRQEVNAILAQSQRNLAPRSSEISVSNVREAITHVQNEYMFGKVVELENRVRSLEVNAATAEGRRLQQSEGRSLELQRTDVSLKKRHIAILIAALIISVVSLVLDLLRSLGYTGFQLKGVISHTYIVSVCSSFMLYLKPLTPAKAGCCHYHLWSKKVKK